MATPETMRAMELKAVMGDPVWLDTYDSLTPCSTIYRVGQPAGIGCASACSLGPAATGEGISSPAYFYLDGVLRNPSGR